MKSRLFYFLIFIILLFSSSIRLTAQCNNLDFEDGTFLNWQRFAGTANNNGPSLALDTGINQHKVLTSSNILDPNSYLTSTQNDPCMMLSSPNGSNYIVRLGNDQTNSGAERIRHTINVTAANSSFTYSYAVVLEDAGHLPNQQPKFTVRTLNSAGQIVGGACGVYSVFAGSDSSFKYNHPNSPNPEVIYKCWTTVAVDLLPFVGQTITIDFTTQDCTLDGHFGYAYVDLACATLQSQAVVALCPGDTMALLTAPPGFINYQWYDTLGVAIDSSEGGNNDSLYVNGNLGDLYSLQAVSTSGCSYSVNYEIQFSEITNTFSKTSTCFGGANATIDVFSVGGASPYSYLWNNGESANSLDSLSAGEYIVSVSSGGCSVTDTVVITEDAPANQLTTSVLYCIGADSIVVQGQPNLSSHQWYSPSGIILPGETDSVIIVQNPLNGSIYTDSTLDGFGCISSNAVTILENQVSNNISTTPNCFGGLAFTSSASISTTGGTGFFSYVWSNGATGPTASGFPTGSQWVDVSSGGCVHRDSFAIVTSPAPAPTSETFLFCQGGPAIVFGPFAASHQWYDANGTLLIGATTDSLVVTMPVENEIYIDTLRDFTGCIQVFKAFFMETDIDLTPSFSNNPCYGYSLGSASVSALGGPQPYFYTWSPAGFSGANTSTYSNLPAGTYSVTVSSSTCVTSETIIISEPARIDTSTLFSHFCKGDDTATVYALPGYSSYNWIFNDDTILSGSNEFHLTNPVIGMPVTVIYHSGGSCPVYDNILLTYGSTSPFFIPDSTTNVFSPNGDSYNDYFLPYTGSDATWSEDFHVDQFTLQIYDRWGRVVFQTTDPQTEGWNGKANGEEMTEEVYYWISTFVSSCKPNGEPVIHKGFVHLLRK